MALHYSRSCTKGRVEVVPLLKLGWVAKVATRTALFSPKLPDVWPALTRVKKPCMAGTSELPTPFA